MTALQGVPTYGNGVGVYDVTDDKVALAGLMLQTAPGVVLPGVFYAGVDLLVTGTAGMAYSVAAYRCATTRGASGGVILGGNDGALSVSTTAAPGSNSRIDLIVHWQREFQVDGVDSEPVIFVVQGTAGAVPVAPSLASYPGAIELARATVSAGATATNGAGVTITQTAPFAAVHGTVARFRTTTERDARLSAPHAGMFAFTSDTGTVWRYSGSAWVGWESPWIAFTPSYSSVTFGTGATISGRKRFIAGRLRVEWRFTFGTSPTVTDFLLDVPDAFESSVANFDAVGGGSIYNGSDIFPLVAARISTQLRVYALRSDGANVYQRTLSSTVPTTFASGMTMFVYADYVAS